MQEARVKTRKWGNSLGLVLPAELVKAEQIKPGEELTIKIEKKQNILRQMFGAVKFKKSVSQAIKETRKELESTWEK